jgi:predicted dehydrogenase
MTSIAVIGLGEFGQEHLRAYSVLPDTTVVAVCDVNAELAECTAASLGIAHWFSDPLKMIREIHPDGLSIVTPAASHLPLTRSAIDLDIAVLVEKPIVAGDHEIAEMLELSNRGIVIPAHILRFARPYVALCDRIRRGDLGKIFGLSAQRHRQTDHSVRFPTTHIALMTMIHDIDQAIWLSGTTAVALTARTHVDSGSGVPDMLMALVDCADGSTWDLRASWLMQEPEPLDRLEVYASNGIGSASPGRDFDLNDAMHRQLQHFIDCIRTSHPPVLVTVAEAVHGIAIAQAIIESAERGGDLVGVRGVG